MEVIEYSTKSKKRGWLKVYQLFTLVIMGLTWNCGSLLHRIKREYL